MGRWVRSAALLCGLVACAAGARGADDAAIRQRMQELEKQQKEMADELQRLRREVEKPKATDEKVEEVERRQGIFADELRRLREALVLPETKELKSFYGLGPAASKVYGVQRGLSIGGYGETNFRAVVGDDDGSVRDEFDYVRLVLYLGYKFNDWIIFNSETEFEHAKTSSSVSSSDGEVAVEFATLDFLLHPMANARTGMLLVPMGFLNEVHEPPFYHGNFRPEVERLILPSTWRSNGGGFFGELLPGLQYRAYGLTSFNAKGYRSNGLREARQSGNRERADDWSAVVRLDYTPIPEVELGGSFYLGDQDQNLDYGPEDDQRRIDAFTQIYEAHAELRTRGLELRSLFALANIDDADILSQDPDIAQTIADVMLGYYFEAAYDVLPLIWSETTHYLAPWFRYSRVDTQDSVPEGFTRDNRQDRNIYELGIDYKPIPQVVFKLEYRNLVAKAGDVPDEVRIGTGFAF